MQKIFAKVFVICAFIFFVQKFEIGQTGYQIKNLKINRDMKFLKLQNCKIVHNLGNLLKNFLVKSNEIYTKIWQLSECKTFLKKIMFVEISTSGNEHFRNATCNHVEKLCRKITGAAFEPFS